MAVSCQEFYERQQPPVDLLPVAAFAAVEQQPPPPPPGADAIRRRLRAAQQGQDRQGLQERLRQRRLQGGQWKQQHVVIALVVAVISFDLENCFFFFVKLEGVHFWQIFAKVWILLIMVLEFPSDVPAPPVARKLISASSYFFSFHKHQL